MRTLITFLTLFFGLSILTIAQTDNQSLGFVVSNPKIQKPGGNYQGNKFVEISCTLENKSEKNLQIKFEEIMLQIYPKEVNQSKDLIKVSAVGINDRNVKMTMTKGNFGSGLGDLMMGATKSECCTYVFPESIFVENNSLTIESEDRGLIFTNSDSKIIIELSKKVETITFLFDVSEFGGTDKILSQNLQLTINKKSIKLK